LLGEHDFRAFGKALKEDATTVRKIFSAEWQGDCQQAAFTICGNAFLYHMVRRIVFVVVQVGLGNLPEEIVSRGLESGETGIVSLAPARGLTLLEVAYSGESYEISSGS
jgi:tRNA pseudouridine38-40 synthase